MQTSKLLLHEIRDPKIYKHYFFLLLLLSNVHHSADEQSLRSTKTQQKICSAEFEDQSNLITNISFSKMGTYVVYSELAIQA